MILANMLARRSGAGQSLPEPLQAFAHLVAMGRCLTIGGSMPAKSKKQQMAAGAALAAKRGERSRASLRGASRQMVKSMSEQQLREFAKTRRKGLPRKKRS
jgi:hypothetical protein